MEDTNMKKTIFAEKAPAAVGPYVHAVEAGNMVFTTGSFLCGSCKTSEGRSDRDRSNRSKIKEKDTRIWKKYIGIRVSFLYNAL